MYQALIVVSFGGPEGPDDVIPFLENVLRGKNVPRARLEEVAEHYNHFGGVSPINEQNRALIEALKTRLEGSDQEMPIYFGNRNWHPLLEDTIRQMRDDGIQSALAFFTSAYSCYSGCRQYRENIIEAREVVGDGAPEIHKLRMFFNHPLFIEAVAARVQTQLDKIEPGKRKATRLVFTAHSIPTLMAENSNYQIQLNEASRLVAEKLSGQFEASFKWDLVFQSRSGPPAQPWLEPDVNDHLKSLAADGVEDVVVIPVGFLSDHMEVLFDLDHEAQETCEEVGLRMLRAETVGTHSSFVEMIYTLIEERTQNQHRESLGELGPSHDVCPNDCCFKE